eukprot:gene39543-50225_t
MRDRALRLWPGLRVDVIPRRGCGTDPRMEDGQPPLCADSSVAPASRPLMRAPPLRACSSRRWGGGKGH